MSKRSQIILQVSGGKHFIFRKMSHQSRILFAVAGFFSLPLSLTSFFFFPPFSPSLFPYHYFIQLILNKAFVEGSNVPGVVLEVKCLLVNLTAISPSSRACSPTGEVGNKEKVHPFVG